jgi:hypothetical protein
MSRTARSSVVLALVIALVADQAAAYHITYPELKPVSGQWNIAVAATKTADKTQFEPQTGCNATAIDAPCIQPVLSHPNGDALKFTFSLKAAPLRTLGDLTPTKVVFRACYSAPFLKDRGWRKATPELNKDRSCPIVLNKPTSLDFQTTPYEFTYNIPNNVTRATWYAAVFVVCNNGTEGITTCQYDTSATTSAQPTYWGTSQITSITSGLKIATAVCSLIAPLFLGAFFVWEYLIKKQK